MAISDNPNNISGPDPKKSNPGPMQPHVLANTNGTLSGPDIPGTGRSAGSGAADNSVNTLSGPDTQSQFISPVPGYKINSGPSPASSGRGTEYISPWPDGKINTGGTGTGSRVSPGPSTRGGGAYISPVDPGARTTDPYYFHANMSEEVLHNYLDRALEVELLSIWGNAWWAPGPSYPSSYNGNISSYPLYPSPGNPLYDPTYDHGKLLQMIVNTGAKFVWDMVFWWDGPGDTGNIDFCMNTLKYDAAYIHYFDPDVILGAAIAETVNASGASGVIVPYLIVSGVIEPDLSVIDMFYLPSLYPLGRPAYLSSGADPLYFDYQSMVFIDNISDCTTNPNGDCHVDITRPETQMWFYYLATRFMDAGCESVMFGDVTEVCRNDSGLYYFWYVTKKIRAYAAHNPATGLPGATRGVVLMNGGISLNDCYYDPYPSSPAPAWERILIPDFTTLGTYYNRCCEGYCDDAGGAIGRRKYPVELYAGRGLLNNTIGGMHPQGWYCAHLPGLSVFDNGGFMSSYFDLTSAGCAAPPPPSAQYPDCYGFDNTTWFVWQETFFRQFILLYTYYRIKCLDPYCHFSMPGRLLYSGVGLTSPTTIGEEIVQYNAYTEQETIANIWNNSFAGPYDWVQHNFTYENAWLCPVNVGSGLIFVGTDTMYYIANDGDVFSYIRTAGSSYNGGTWLFTNVSYAASVHMPGGSWPVKAKSDLVASPDATRLLYIGIDGYIHGFDIVDVWTYKYIYSTAGGALVYAGGPGIFDGFMTNQLIVNGLTAYGGLIYPGNNSIFFIAQGPDLYEDGYSTGITQTIQCFTNLVGIWGLNAPIFLAKRIYGTSYLGQYQPEKGLTYDSAAGRLYYVATNGYLAYYEVRSLTDFYYVACPGNFALYDSNLQIAGNLAIYTNRIYFIAQSLVDGSNWAYCLVDDGTPTWALVNIKGSVDISEPSASQYQSDPVGSIAISPDGTTVAYIGVVETTAFTHLSANIVGVFYYTFDGRSYYYNTTAKQNLLARVNSLQFTGTSDLYYINGPDNSVYHNVFQEAYCENDSFNPYPNL